MPEYITVSEDFRKLDVPQNELVLGCVGDAWVRRIYFTAPRYCDGTDLSGFDFTVQFVNAANESDVYEVDDVTASTDTVTFSWLVSPIACAVVGNTEVSIVVSDVDSETGDVLHRFLSTTYKWEVLPAITAEGGEAVEAQTYVEAMIAAWQADIDTMIASANNRNYDTVADMQADTTLTAGMICHTLGFHAAGDGGAAWYQVTDDAMANGMDVIALDNGLYVELQITDAYVTPEMFGAYGDGVHDDTSFIQQCVNISRVIMFSKKTYLVSISENHGSCLIVPSNTSIVFNNSTIEMTGTTYESYQIIYINNAENVSIQGMASIVGERDSHIGATGEWGMCIAITSSDNVYIENIDISNGFGDGIYILNSTDIVINNCNIHNNRRNNISIISCENCIISNCKLDKPNGTTPQANISIEHNTTDDYIKNLIIENCVMSNTYGYFSVYVTTRSDGNSVKIINCKMDRPFTTDAISGDYNNIELDHCEIISNDSMGTINAGNVPANTFVTYDNVLFFGGGALLRHVGNSMHNLIIKNSTVKNATYSRLSARLGGNDISNNFIHIFVDPTNVSFTDYVSSLFPANTENALIVENIIPFDIQTAPTSCFFSNYIYNLTTDASRALILTGEASVPMGQVYKIINNSSVRYTIAVGGFYLINANDATTTQLLVVPAGKYCELWNINHNIYYRII